MTSDSGASGNRPDPSGSRPDPSRNLEQQVDQAQSQVLGFALAGLFVAGVGIAVAIAAWPGTEPAYSYGVGETTEDTGSVGWAIAGLIATGAGQLLLAVAVIAYGVMLGLRAAGTRT